MNDEYQEDLRILRKSIKTSNWVELNDYVVRCMKQKKEREIWIFTRRLFPWEAYTTFGPTLST